MSLNFVRKVHTIDVVYPLVLESRSLSPKTPANCLLNLDPDYSLSLMVIFNMDYVSYHLSLGVINHTGYMGVFVFPSCYSISERTEKHRVSPRLH